MDWLTLTIILSMIASTLVLSMRAITPETNPFLFMSIVTGLAFSLLIVFCLSRDISLVMSAKATCVALLAGFSVTFLDLALIFMFRKGATVSVSMQLFRVTGIVISAMIGLALFQESINLIKACGIILACISVYLLNSKPKGEHI